MGSCTSKNNSTPAFKSNTYLEEDYEGLPMILFKVNVSRLKIRELRASALKAKTASVVMKIQERVIEFGEVQLIDEVLRWPADQNFQYQSTLLHMNTDKIEILVYSKKKVVCSCEITMKSIIDGPVFQNIALISNGLIIGRISFEMEMLEVTDLFITPTEINCDLGEENLGNFSVSLRFASEFIKESLQSPIHETPSWTFMQGSLEPPNLSLEVTMKSIRDAALQIRVHKHHKSGKEPELVAECWVSFTKLFAEDMEAIYRTESFLASRSKEQGTRLDFEKLVKSMRRVHFKKINENLWRFGRKIGAVTGSLKLSGIPTFVQLISGVNTEKGYSVQSIVYMSDIGSKGKENLPKMIVELIKITNELEETIHFKPGKEGITYERELLKKKKEMFERLFIILQSTQKDSMISFIYKNQISMMRSQEGLLRLGRHLADYAKLVNYDIKPNYFLCLSYLIKRGELDIGYLTGECTDESIQSMKTATAVEYLKFLHSFTILALSRMAFKGVDKITEDFVYTALAVAWFRVPELREHMIKLLKEKSYYSIDEWRRTDIDLDDEHSHDISLVFNWNPFYSMIPDKSVKIEPFMAALYQDAWRQKFQKRGMSFFRFFTAWLMHIHDQTCTQQVLWSEIAGYKILLKAFLIEMKEKPIVEYPDALVECASLLVHNQKLLNVMVRILFLKTNIYDFNTVQECYHLLDTLFSSVYQASRCLPPAFDSEFFYLGIKISLSDENALNVAKCLSFIYNQFHLIQGSLRVKIIYEVIIKKKLKKFFFHWCRDLRQTLHYLILYRILSLSKFNFEGNEGSQEDAVMAASLKSKIKEFSEETCRHDQRPYFQTAMKEFRDIKVKYKEWIKNIPTSTGMLYGISDTFPYPTITIKFNFLDLAEKKIEELW